MLLRRERRCGRPGRRRLGHIPGRAGRGLGGKGTPTGVEPFYGPFRPRGGSLRRVEWLKRGCGALWAALGRFSAAPAAGSVVFAVFWRVPGAEPLAAEELVGAASAWAGRSCMRSLRRAGSEQSTRRTCPASGPRRRSACQRSGWSRQGVSWTRDSLGVPCPGAGRRFPRGTGSRSRSCA